MVESEVKLQESLNMAQTQLVLVHMTYYNS